MATQLNQNNVFTQLINLDGLDAFWGKVKAFIENNEKVTSEALNDLNSRIDNLNVGVTSIIAGDGLAGGTITSSGTISHADTSTLKGSYGPTANVTGNNASTIVVPQITVDKFGHVTGVTNRTYTSVDTKVSSAENHYDPKEDTSAVIYASSGTATNITGTSGKLNVVTGLKRDAKGHIVGVASKNIYAKDTVEHTNVTWSTASTKNSLCPVDVAMSSFHNANRLAFANPDGITVQYSNNGGSTWLDYGLSNMEKVALVSGNSSSIRIGKKTLQDKCTANDQLRLIINATNCGVYTEAKRLLLNVCTEGAAGSSVKIEYSKKGSENVYIHYSTYSVDGWSGWNGIPLMGRFGGSDSQTNNWANIRLTFSITGLSFEDYSGALSLYDMFLYGDTYWATPSNMGKHGHLYRWDSNQHAIFPANVYATTFYGDLNGTAAYSTRLGTSSSSYTKSQLDDILNNKVNKSDVATSHTHNYIKNTYVTSPSNAYASDDIVTKSFHIGSSGGSGQAGFAGDTTGFPINNNANGILWVGTHANGYGGQLGFSSNENIYYRFISGGSFPTTTNGASWNRLVFEKDLSGYKTKQTAVSSPNASTTTSTTFIDTISQDANGKITATKKTIKVPTWSGSTGSAGGHSHTINADSTNVSTVSTSSHTHTIPKTTTTGTTVAKSDHTHALTATGTVSSTFTGKAATSGSASTSTGHTTSVATAGHTHSIASSGSHTHTPGNAGGHSHTVTATGTVSSSFTGKAATSGSASTSTGHTTTVAAQGHTHSVTGTVASAGGSHTHSVTAAGTVSLSGSATGGVLTITAAFSGTSVTSGSTSIAHSHTFSSGSASATGTNGVTVPTSSHTHSVTADGTVSSSFSGTSATTSSVDDHTHTISSSGAHTHTASATANDTTNRVTVPTSSHTHSVTADGTVSSSFSGTSATTSSISGTVTVASNTHTHTASADETNVVTVSTSSHTHTSESAGGHTHTVSGTNSI